MNTVEELRQCLALQKQLDEQLMALRARFKAVLEAGQVQGTLYVEIDGEMYALEREDPEQEMLRNAKATARKLGGFYNYRLVNRGKVMR